MKGYEIIRDIVKAKMPDREQVREECVRQSVKKGASRGVWIARAAFVTVPVCAAVAIIALIAGTNGINGTSNMSKESLLSLNNRMDVEGLQMPEIELPDNTDGIITDASNSGNTAENDPGSGVGGNSGNGENGGNGGVGGNSGNGGSSVGNNGNKDNAIIHSIDNNMMSYDSRYSDRGAYYTENRPETSCSYTIAMGERTTGGYSIIIDKVDMDDQGNVEVIVSEKTPGKEVMVTQALTYPICRLTLFGEPNSVVIRTVTGEVFKVIY